MMITGVHGRFIAGKCPPCPAAASTEWVDRIPRPCDDPHRRDIPPEFGVPSLPAGSGGSGGGGASDVRTGAADDTGLPTRLIVAGGGGGAAGAAGGDGGLEGAPGGDGSVVFNLPDVFPTRLVPGGTPGAGAQGVEAPGADGTDAFIEFVGGRPMGSFEGDAGAGGGGGFVGGGGGMSAASGASGGLISWSGTSSGGAGGSSLVPGEALCPVLVEDGARAGGGLIVITFAPGRSPARACT
jgi:hypothetical protein